MDLNKIYHGDCFEVMSEFPDNSVDMVLTDPPYGTTNCKWDSEVDLEELWRHYRRICKPTCPILIFSQTPFDKVLGVSNLPWLRYEWIWEKTQATGFFNAKKMPMKAHENILVFYEKLPEYYPQMTEGHPPINSYTKRASVVNKTQIYGKVSSDVSGGGETIRYPRSVLTYPSDKQKTKLNGTIHPTQKPLALLEYFVNTYTKRGNVVLDNFLGSGTTAVACINTGRNFVGIEKEEEYVGIAKKRVAEAEGSCGG